MQDAQAERSSCWKLLLPEHRLHIPAHWLSEQLVAVTCQKLDELSWNTRRWACLEVFVLDWTPEPSEEVKTLWQLSRGEEIERWTQDTYASTNQGTNCSASTGECLWFVLFFNVLHSAFRCLDRRTFFDLNACDNLMYYLECSALSSLASLRIYSSTLAARACARNQRWHTTSTSVLATWISSAWRHLKQILWL